MSDIIKPPIFPDLSNNKVHEIVAEYIDDASSIYDVKMSGLM